jgi:hypothetical protein
VERKKNIMKKSLLIAALFLISPLSSLLAVANENPFSLSEEQYSTIENRLSGMSNAELQDRLSLLQEDKASLEEEQENGDASAESSTELSLINAEIFQIQQILGIVAAAGILTALTDDDSDPDVTPPFLTILGDNPATVEVNTSYSDAGATANDNVDGAITVSSSGTVDTTTVGSYQITYVATDASGNIATAFRTVNVVDTTAPVVTVTGSATVTHEFNEPYTDAGATARDASGADDNTLPVVTTSTVDVAVVGTYTVTYTATDASGNVGTATRTVNVVDTTAPVVTVTGSATVTVEAGETYNDPGATARDASGADNNTLPVVASGPAYNPNYGTVDTDEVGTFVVTYTATDASGNVGTATRTVNVVDTTAPVFTSSALFTADENQTSIGTVTASDVFSVTFTISGSELQITSGGILTFVTAPDYETKSLYTATVTATDANNNTATQDITVNVNDVGGSDDDPATGTGTGTSTSTGTGTSTSTSTSTGTGTST